jgi:perosamine synthetase
MATRISRAEVIPHSRPQISGVDLAAVRSVLESGMIADGSETAALEAEVAASLEAPGAVATSSGTEALVLAIRALGLGAGDEVVLPSYTCRAVWDAVRLTGASPVLCDVGPQWIMTGETVREALTDRTAAVIVVHTFGIAAPVEEIASLGFPVVEDCAQGFGPGFGDPAVGRTGVFTVLSLHATKLLTAGEGGLLVARDPEKLGRAQSLVTGDGGSLSVLRQRSPLSDLQAALARSQLARFQALLQRRQELADLYLETLAGIPGIPVSIRDRSIFFRFPVEVEADIEELGRRFAEQGIQVRRGVDALLHRGAGLEDADFPGATDRFRRTLSIPIYPALTDEQAARVCAVAAAILTEA